MNTNPTAWFMLVWIGVLIAWDVWIFQVDADWTISAVLLRWARHWPVLPFAFCFATGVLVGHLFLPQSPK